MQWQCNAELILQQTADVIVGTLPYRSRTVLCANELRKDVRLLQRRTPSAASAIAVRARRRGMQKSKANIDYGLTYIRGKHVWASFQVRVALLACDRRAAMDRLACWCAQWTSIDRGTTGVEEVGWRRAHWKAYASLRAGWCQCTPAPCRSHPPRPSLSSRPEPSLSACDFVCPRLRIAFCGWPRSSQRLACSARAERMQMEGPPVHNIFWSASAWR